jgi:hypothetical protein
LGVDERNREREREREGERDIALVWKRKRSDASRNYIVTRMLSFRDDSCFLAHHHGYPGLEKEISHTFYQVDAHAGTLGSYLKILDTFPN